MLTQRKKKDFEYKKYCIIEQMEKQKSLDILRHSTAHIMAAAVMELFPGTKVAIGPSIEDGFYYDFDREQAFTPGDLIRIEEKMAEIIKADYPFICSYVPKGEAVKEFREKGEKYKAEIASQIEDDKVSMYRSGNFTDLCRGPHINSTGELKYFKLLSIAGAYWRGDSSREQLQRIYGTAFLTKKDIDDYLTGIEEAHKRDHRKLGEDLDLFSIDETVGGGLVLWHPKGALLKDIIENYWKKFHLENGYDLLSTPHIASEELFKVSGHLQTYSENMYASMEIEGKPYRIKPMNCPMHLMIYKTKLHSYRELPVRYAELGTVYRFEKSGVLHGLLRVRGFTQDDGHIIVAPEQLEEEMLGVFNMAVNCLKTFGFNEYKIYFATRPEKKYVGEIEYWEKAQNSIENALKKTGCVYEIDEGGGAFYGPKIDIKIKDVIGRLWQCSTLQFDFNLPERFDIFYVNSSGKKARPYMIHRALLGSLERFIGVLLEHYAGALPLWLSPIQVAVANINEEQRGFCEGLSQELKKNNIRVIFDGRNEKIGRKIRENAMQKIPYIAVIGNKEKDACAVAVRARGNRDLGVMSVDNFISFVKEESVCTSGL
ncbi:threonine--tRNA ligase [Candidatus Endomicrobiellum trichonymphae]|uniref:Threonine--tRNA ligase n=1 Tax=Endomicrobium trichonymphae TaxID=1408204 RepID=B1GZQ2_ENDTX|nr:threonine--tRNA ligase [Candidatus Endomicrobium trichonymphae]BAG13734.1 threonyl-tRNA synthetase [Candidatus Endomicrobium trichonymphae]